MRKILLALALTFLLGKAMSQGIYQPVTPTAYGSNNLRGVFRTALLIPSGCGVPGAMSLYSVDSSRFALYGDTCANKLYFYNPRTRQWLLSGQTSIPWDSVSGKPSNFPTTYALSNDVQDSVQNRVPYENATRSVNLGNYRLNARGLLMDSLWARSSGGTVAVTNSGTKSFSWGAGGSSEVTFYGFAGMDFNRSGSMTSTSFTPKVYVDSLAALRVRYTDTAAMLADYVDLGSSQTIAGLKTFSNDIVVNGYTFGRGANNNSGNLAIGSLTLTATTVGSLPNIAIGNSALRNITTGASNVAIGTNIMTGSTVGSGNTNVGQNSFADVTSGGNNTSLGNIAGRFTSGSASVTSIDNSTYIGANTRPSATTGVTNETALGYLATGNGSNTVTIGNSSVTGNYFNGNIRSSNGTAFLKNMANGSSSDSVIVSNNGELRKIAQSSIVGSGGTVTSVSAGIGMSFTTITSSGAVNADTTVLATRAYAAGLDVAKANTSLNNVNGVLSSTYGGAGSVSGILKANGSGVVSAAVAGTDYVIPSALSSYLPKTAGSGQSITGDLYLTGLSGGRGIYLNENASYTSAFLLQAGGGSAGFGGGIAMYGHSHPTKAGWITAGISASSGGKFSVNNNGLGSGTDVFTVGIDGLVTATNTLSGTSLSMSGGGTFGSGASTATNMIAITSSYATANAERGSIAWGDGSGIVGKIYSTFNGSNSTRLHFGGLFNGSYNGADLMVLDGNTANVGIGTSAPSNALTVNRPTSTASYLVGTNGSGVQTAMGVAGDNGSLLGTLSNNDLRFVVNGSVVGRFTTAGNLGINNLGANARLEVAASTGEVFRADAASGLPMIVANQTVLQLAGSSARVGVGTFSPETKFQVSGTSGITSFTGTSRMGISTAGATSSTDYSGIDFDVLTASAPRARIAAKFTASGSVLEFGTSDNYASGITNTALSINWTGAATFSNNITASGYLQSSDRLYLSGNVNISSWISSSLTAGYDVAGTNGWVNADGSLLLGTNGTARLTIASTGAATFSSSVTATRYISNGGAEAYKLVPTANGVYGSTNFLRWYRADGTTSRALVGYLSNNDQKFQIYTDETGGTIDMYSGAGVLALTLGANQAATFSSSVTVGGALSFSPSSSKIVSGITDFAIRNNADNTSMLHFNNSTLAATFTGSVHGIGFRYAYAAKSSNYTLTDNDDYINVTSSCTITLPTAVGRSGKRYVIKCTGSAVATIASTSSQTIDGNAASTYSFGGPNYNIMIVYSDGSNWFLEAWQTGI